MQEQEFTTFAPHIHHLCRDSYNQLRQLHHTVARSYTTYAPLIHSFITDRLDYSCYIRFIREKTSVDKPLLEHMSKNKKLNAR